MTHSFSTNYLNVFDIEVIKLVVETCLLFGYKTTVEIIYASIHNVVNKSITN